MEPIAESDAGRTCRCDTTRPTLGATYEDDDGALRCWDCAGLVPRVTPAAEKVAAWPDPNNWPSNAEFVAMVKSVPADFPLCDCGVQDGTSESTNPDDRSEVLPHHFDCSAVYAWAAVRRWAADHGVLPPGSGR